MKKNLFFILFGFIAIAAAYQNCSPSSGIKTSTAGQASSSSSSPPNSSQSISMAEAIGYRCVSNQNKVRCSGGNFSGTGTVYIPFTSSPIDLLTHQVTQLSGGPFNLCYLDQGDVYCWGNNSDGTVGDGTFTNRSQPSKVSGLTEKNLENCSWFCACVCTGCFWKSKVLGLWLVWANRDWRQQCNCSCCRCCRT